MQSKRDTLPARWMVASQIVSGVYSNANFCAHPADRWAHLRTASHMLRSRLSCFVSAETLKTGRLISVARLPWAHSPRLQPLHSFLLTTNVSNKSGNLLFAQR